MGCTEIDEPGDAGTRSGSALAPFTAHARTSAIAPNAVFACRSSCWSDVPFNACRVQRNRCFKRATNERAKDHCREMSRTCRQVRSNCLHSCTATGQPGLEKEPREALKLDPETEDSDDPVSPN